MCLLVGLRAPSNFGAEYKADFDGIFPGLAEAFGVPLAPDFFAGLDGVAPEESARVFPARQVAPECRGRGAHCRGAGARGILAADSAGMRVIPSSPECDWAVMFAPAILIAILAMTCGDDLT